jgi:hypothetical protein
MPTVFSRLANSQKYAKYAPPVFGADGKVNTVESYVHIKGGANLANKHLETPRGVATIITDEEAAALKKNPIFLLHEDRGHVTIETSATEKDVEKVVSDMGQEADLSAPITPSDFTENDGVIGDNYNGKPTVETTLGGRFGSNKKNR